MHLSSSGARALPVLGRPSFERALADHGLEGLARSKVRTLQVNVGKLCNMACHHCHVEAGPKRSEIMSAEVADRVLALLAKSPTVEVVDFTGGAPELNPHFRRLVQVSRASGRRVIDRCNLTVLFEPGLSDLAEFLAAQEVEIVASLPCYSRENLEKQRGKGAFDKSITALKFLNSLGYGRAGSALRLNLVYNPVGAALPPGQAKLEARYKSELLEHFGIEFHELLTITNMPIKRFAEALERSGEYDHYMSLLVNHFNPATADGLMCRSLASVGFDGQLYDCDFNQMLEIPLGDRRTTIFDVESLDELVGDRIATDSHCFGCTAGAGSSCSGSLQG